MTHSIHRGFVRSAANRLDADAPMDTSLFRDCVVNNALHIADVNAQVRVDWVIGSPGEFDTFPTRDSGSDEYGKIMVFGYFPINLAPEGSAYKFRVRLYGASASGSVTFRVAISAHPDLVVDFVNFSTSSATAVWLEDDPAILTVPASSIAGTSSGYESPIKTVATALAAGAPVPTTQVQVPMMCATVWANSTNAELHGLYVAEFPT